MSTLNPNTTLLTASKGTASDLTPAQLQTQQRVINFATTNVQPPSPIYVSGNEKILVNCLNSVPGATLGISYRQLFSDGTITHMEQSFPLTSDRTNNQFNIDLQEGFLLSVHLSAKGASVHRGQMWVEAAIELGRSLAGAFVQELVSGYVVNNGSTGWPGGPIEPSVSGQGMLYAIQNATPAAGADWTVTVPNGARWRVRSVDARLTTSAAVATRDVDIIVTDPGAVEVYAASAAVTQLASLAVRYVFADVPFNAPTDAARSIVPAIPDLILFAGWKISSVTANIQVADQWTTQVIYVEEWLEN